MNRWIARAAIVAALAATTTAAGGCEQFLFLPMMVGAIIRIDSEVAAKNGHIEVAGQVVDEEGRPLDDVEVTSIVWGWRPAPEFNVEMAPKQARQTVHGDFRFPFSDCCNVTLIFRRPGYEQRALQFAFADQPAVTPGGANVESHSMWGAPQTEKVPIDSTQVGPAPLKVRDLKVVMKQIAGGYRLHEDLLGRDTGGPVPVAAAGVPLAYAVLAQGKVDLIRGGRLWPEFEDVLWPTMGPNGRLAYGRDVEGRRQWFIDGLWGNGCMNARRPLFAPDGSFVYEALYDAKWRVAPEHYPLFTEMPEFGGVADKAFIRRGPAFEIAYAGRNGAKWIVMEGRRQALVADECRYLPMGAGDRGQAVDDDGFARLGWTADNGHWGCAFRRGSQWTLVIDGRMWGAYDKVAWGPTFLEDGTLVCLAARGGNLYRVHLVPGP